MGQSREKGRGTSRPGQEGLKQPHLAGGEDGALFIIKHMVRHDISPRRPVRLFLRRQNGYKFKKSFGSEDEVIWFVEPYLRLCCTVCKDRGIVQKVLNVGGIRDGWSNFPHAQKKLPFASSHRDEGHKGQCPLCKTMHELHRDGMKKYVKPISLTKETK